ncbi:MAG TPA: serine/threonine-protein kinase [Spirillospora sp.]
MTTHTGENGEALRPGDPEMLGPYRLVGRLGRGGMGTVYLGEDGTGRRVAVKVINRELAGESAFRERFRREVTAARQVRRFCTAPVIDAELDNDPLYVVTEYIEGPSLEKAVAERGPLPGSELEGLAVGVATALAAIHGAGIVHRDLKPANVLLSSTGPRVIDFGIARALDAPDGPTRTGQFVGTPNYLPPELLRGEPVTPASDVFSWGCVVAYAGTGQAPFAGNTVPEIFYRVAHEEPKLDGLDPGLRDIVAAALSKDPRSRPSVQDLLARLVGNGTTDPATLAQTVQATWLRTPTDPTVQARSGPVVPPVASGVSDPTRDDATLPQSAVQHGVGPHGGGPQGVGSQGAGPHGFGAQGVAQHGSGPSPSGGPAGRSRPMVVGAAAAAVAVLVIVVVVVLRSGGPPDNLAPVFSDDFSNAESGWQSFDEQYGYRDGQYFLRTTEFNETVIRWVPKDNVESFPDPLLATVTTKVTEGSPDAQYGMMCRSVDDGEQRYDFLIRNDGKGAVVRKVDGDRGNRELKATDSVSGFSEEGPNKLQIGCESQDDGKTVRLRLWVNGKEVIDVTDKEQPIGNGKVGLAAVRGGNKTQMVTVMFDDFDMSKILD